MSEVCTTCAPVIQCCTGNSPFAYSVTGGTLISSDQTGFIFQCPPGFTCLPGAYPREVIMPRGSVQYRLNYNPGSGPVPPIIVPCIGGDIVAHVPLGATLDQIIALVKKMVAKCVQQKAKAIVTPRNPSFRIYNSPQSITLCDSEHVLSGSLSGPYSISGNVVTISSGVVGVTCGDSSTAGIAACQTQADDLASQQLFDAVDAALESGELVCASPFDWHDLVWLAPVIVIPPHGGNAAASGSQNTAAASMNAASVLSNQGSGFISSDGNLMYSGPDLNCNLRINITTYSPQNSGNVLTFLARVYSGVNIFMDVIKTGHVAVGPYDFPFTLPASPIPYPVTVNCSANWTSAGAATVAVAGNIVLTKV